MVKTFGKIPHRFYDQQPLIESNLDKNNSPNKKKNVIQMKITALIRKTHSILRLLNPSCEASLTTVIRPLEKKRTRYE